MKKLVTALAVVATATVLLAGAASGSTRSVTVQQPPARIFAEAEAATLAARSVTLTEHLVLGGKALYIKAKGRWPNRVELSVVSQGVSEEIVVVASTVYVEANALGWESSYRLPAAAAAELAGRWFTTSLSDPQLGASPAGLNPKSLERQVFSLVGRASSKLAVRPGRVAGRRALVLSDAGGAVYVAATGTPYVLRVTSTLPSDRGFLEFSGYGSSTNFAVPVGATSLDAALAQAASPATTSSAAA
ncbi:MAG TPA: hypothetical protein VMU75_13615 [Acidimicrobiales bacterium]|nr:hypothetical protein [Acidimicrobiales bacterium]